jgi:hypothetical protein
LSFDLSEPPVLSLLVEDDLDPTDDHFESHVMRGGHPRHVLVLLSVLLLTLLLLPQLLEGKYVFRLFLVDQLVDLLLDLALDLTLVDLEQLLVYRWPPRRPLITPQ